MTTKISTANLDATITTLIGSGGGPKATAITYPGNDLAADPAGSQTIAITGTGFVAGCSVFVGTVQATVVTVVSATSVTFTSPALAAGTYTLYVVNPDGGTATIVPGVSYSGTPAWTTGAGSLGTAYEYAAISNTVAATGDGSITYSVLSGTLPTGSTLNTNTGTITGTSPASAGATTYTFVIRATDAQLQDTDRSFSITVNTDVVTWTTPAADSVTALGKDTASTTALLATSAAGNAITYTANTLPAGLSISGATVTGTPTVVASTASTFTATAATTGKTATATINWTVSVAVDTYFAYTTLLLSGSASTETFITDASTNNFGVAIAGDTKPNNFNPYTPGYYSNYFDGSGDYLTVPSNAALAFGTGDFTIEGWHYLTAAASTIKYILDCRNGGGAQGATVILIQDSLYQYYVNGAYVASGGTPSTNVWTHFALVKTAGSTKLYINGSVVFTYADTVNYTSSSIRIGTEWSVSGSYDWQGYISNFRVVKGTAVYTSAFTLPTAPLTAIANTSLLTCQSNRFIDNSSNAFAVTVAGQTKISSTNPFVPNTQYAAYGSTYFDGTGDQLTVASPNQLTNFGTGDFTVECWIYFNVVPTNTAAIISNYSDFYLNNRGNGTIALTNASTVYALTAGTLTVGNWFHIAVVRSSGSSKIYINGQGGTAVACNVNFNSTNTVYIGGDGNGTINGYIANLRVVKGVAVYTANFTVPAAPLTATQSANTNGNPSVAITGSATSLLTCQTNQPASNSMFLDNSTNALAITRAGNVSAGTSSPYGANWSNYFDGSGQAFYNSSFTGASFGTSNNFTIEMWVLWTASAASNQTVFELTGATRMIIGRSTTGIRLFNHITERGYTVTVPVGTWNHIAIVRNSGTISVYLNGVSGTSYADTYNWAHTQFYVGRNSDGVELTSAMYLSNLRVVNGTAVYNSNFAVPTAPLTAISGTTLLIGKSNGFVDNSANAFPITLIGTPSVQRFSPFSPQTQTAITHSGYFDGTGDYLTAAANAAFVFGTGAFTIEAWIYPTVNGPTTGNWIYSNISTASGNSEVGLILLNAGTIRLSTWNAAIATSTITAPLNTWTHVVGSFDGTTYRIFVNGVLSGTSTGVHTLSGTGGAIIGSAGVAGISLFTGYISNVRIVKGVAVYTAAFTPSTAPLTATQLANTNGNPSAAITGTQTSLLTCQSATFVDNSTNSFALTVTGETKPRTVNPFGFTNATAAYSAATYGGSAYFDGAGDTLSVPFTSAINLGTNNFTMEAWCYPTTTTNGIDSIWGSSNYSIMLYHSGTSWTLEVGDGGGNYFTIGGTAPIYAWNHMALTRSGSTFNLWINGVSAGTGTTAGTMKYGSTLFIGGNGNAQNFTGYMSNYRLVNGTAVYKSNFVPPAAPLTAITNTGLLLNMTSAGVYDSASMNDLETVADAKRVSTHTPYAGSYYSNYFDGAGDYLSVPSNAAFEFGTGDFTIELWIYIPGGITSPLGVISHGTGAIDNSYWSLEGIAGGNIGFFAANSATQYFATTTQPWTLGWAHLAVSRSGNNSKLFVNGFQQGATYTINNSFAASGNLYIGTSSYTPASRVMPLGYISNVRLVKGVAVYTANFTPNTTPLTAIANTSLLTCQSNRFIDNSTNAFTITKAGETSVQSFNPFQRNSGTTLYFDGSGDVLSTLASQNFVFNGDFTVEGWVYIDSTMTSTRPDNLKTFIFMGWNTGNTPQLFVYGNTTIPGIGLGYYDSTNSWEVAVTVPKDQWVHIAYVRTGTTLYGFVAGTRYTINASISATIGTNNTMVIAGNPNQVSAYYSYLKGYINDVRITKGYARYTANFAPPTTAFIAR